MTDVFQRDSNAGAVKESIGNVSIRHSDDDPILSRVALPLSAVFYPLGFAVEISTNTQVVLDAAAMNWGSLRRIYPKEMLKLKIVIAPGGSEVCPPAPVIRGQRHLLSIVADAHNQAICDLQAGVAYMWLNDSALHHLDYLQHHFLEAATLVLISGLYATPLHAACVSLNGHGMLLCGESGAGKSSLAYACARTGWTFTSDDASYLLRNGLRPKAIGNSRQVRFRPSAKDLFPELQGRGITPRLEGKPSIEVPTAELPPLVTADEATIHSIIFLNRQQFADAELIPLDRNTISERFRKDLYPTDYIQTLQVEALEQLASAAAFELRYCVLEDAVECLQTLVRSTSDSAYITASNAT
ncbi:aldolase [Granulicella sp. dw_53]|uniref:HPr kinase/phosphorylase n=1 Tax=Granulicella sp. dw_53 TaxID=2719792 RepID=UPI001BD6CC0A|nr:aldolase [Granulicella sp. dw_53]